MTNNTTVTLLVITILCAISGCGETAEPKDPDPTDPQQVAEAFWNAVVAEDYAKAETFVLSEDRESFRTEAIEQLKELPPLPKRPHVKAKVDGDRGEAIIENWEFGDGPEMVFQEGRWWITR